MPPSEKIRSLEDLARQASAVRAEGRRVVLCHGVFDILHPGHILHLREARTFGDFLAVTLTPDRFVRKGPGRPVFNERLRMETLAALEFVDAVALNSWPTAVEAIRQVGPDVYAKGKDYADPSSDVTRKILDEEEAVRSVGGRIRFTDTEVFSSSELANRFFSAYPPKTQEYLADFRRRHSSDEILGKLQELARLRVLVVGEAIVDQYTYCLPLAKSPKEFIVASRFQSDEYFAGGVLATANHLGGFCKHVTLATVLGADGEHEEFIRGKMRPDIDLRIVKAPDRPTIVKRRFLEPSFMTKLFELQYLEDAPLGPAETSSLAQILERELPHHDLVVVSDFGHGVLTGPIQALLGNWKGFLAVNTQTNSANLGFNPITRYGRVEYACLDEAEVRLAMRAKYDELRPVVLKLREQLGARGVMVTRGPRGSLMLDAEGNATEAPALSVNVVDRVGAGDAFFAVTAPCVFAGNAPDVVNFVGNCVGALKVAIVCNREPVDPVSLFKFVQHVLK